MSFNACTHFEGQISAMGPTWGASEFCWDALPAQKPPMMPRSDKGARTGGYGSGAAALSARLAHMQQAGARAFEYREEETQQPLRRGLVPGGQRQQARAPAAAGQPVGQGCNPGSQVMPPPLQPPPQQQQQMQQQQHHQPQGRPEGKQPQGRQPAIAAVAAGMAAAVPGSGGGGGSGSAATVAQPAGKPVAAPVRAEMSLERYLEFHSHLTKGAGSVQLLSELEKSVLKANDLKQVFSGGNAANRTAGPRLVACA